MEKSLFNLMTRRFAFWLVVILLASTPLFYFIVTNYYAEDLIEVAKLAGVPEEQLDLERDTVVGLLIQISFILVILGLTIFIVVRTIPVKLWKPFYTTLDILRKFKVEDGVVPEFPKTKVKEFSQLNNTLTQILTDSTHSYKVQKEFTENASHELQTPLAVVQNKLDLLLQDEDLTERQASLLQDIYHEVKRTSALSRNILLLAKLENNQFQLVEEVPLDEELHQVLPSLKMLSGDLAIDLQITNAPTLRCQKMLLDCMVNNLVVNAVRHNHPGGDISIRVDEHSLTVSNTSDEPELDGEHIFNRFYRSSDTQKGNGLGLSIVKAICDYHHWKVGYFYSEGQHHFRVEFK